MPSSARALRSLAPPRRAPAPPATAGRRLCLGVAALLVAGHDPALRPPPREPPPHHRPPPLPWLAFEAGTAPAAATPAATPDDDTLPDDILAQLDAPHEDDGEDDSDDGPVIFDEEAGHDHGHPRVRVVHRSGRPVFVIDFDFDDEVIEGSVAGWGAAWRDGGDGELLDEGSAQAGDDPDHPTGDSTALRAASDGVCRGDLLCLLASSAGRGALPLPAALVSSYDAARDAFREGRYRDAARAFGDVAAGLPDPPAPSPPGAVDRRFVCAQAALALLAARASTDGSGGVEEAFDTCPPALPLDGTAPPPGASPAALTAAHHEPASDPPTHL